MRIFVIDGPGGGGSNTQQEYSVLSPIARQRLIKNKFHGEGDRLLGREDEEKLPVGPRKTGQYAINIVVVTKKIIF